MSTTYRSTGIGSEQNTSSSTDVSSFTVPINTASTIQLIHANFGMFTETNNFNCRFEMQNSSSIAQQMNYRVWTGATTSTFGGTNQSNMPINYWNLGAANSSVALSGESFRVMIWLHNLSVGSEPFSNVIAWGRTNYESSSGANQSVTWESRLRSQDTEISYLKFYPQAGNFVYYRYTVWDIAD